MKPLLARSNSSPQSSTSSHPHTHSNQQILQQQQQQHQPQQNQQQQQQQQSNITAPLKKSYYRSGPIISPYHLIHYHSVKQNNHSNNDHDHEPSEFASSGPGSGGGGGGVLGVGQLSSGFVNVTGWLTRRGSVPDHRQGVLYDAAAAGTAAAKPGQSRPAVGNRKGSVTQQDDGLGKQRSGQLTLEGRKTATNAASTTLTSTNATTTTGSSSNTLSATTSKPTKEDLIKARRYKAIMEEISQSIHRLESSAGQQIIQLTETYESVVGKLDELQVMTTRFAELQKMTTELVDNFTVKEEEFVLDMEGQIKTVGAYQEDVAAIRVLQRRLDLQRRAVENYKNRLETVEERISRQKELEVVWRQRASRRLRILWGVISVLVILWLLASSTQDSYPVGMDDVEEGDEQPPEQHFMEDALGVKFEYGSLPKEVLSVEAERLLRERHQNDGL